LLSTAADLYRWHVALRGGDVLGKDARQRYFAPHVREGGLGGGHYGYGWSVGKSRQGKRVVAHNGSNGVFFADLRIYPDDDAVMILATNGSGLKHMSELGTAERLAFADPGK
jgi:CubicO group peptidase (beta-lactamase class C family)